LTFVGRLQFETSQFRWQKGALIGSGSFGRVHLGLNLDTGEMIAVKQVNLASEKLDEQSSEVRLVLIVAFLQLDHSSPGVAVHI
jgi:serine/threonine protein kinase